MNKTNQEIKTFKRIEKKYWLSKQQYDAFSKTINTYMEADKFGISNISSLYFDNDYFSLINHSIEKPIFKEKLRIRFYGLDIDNVFIEIKRKLDGVGYKRRIKTTYEDAVNLLNGKRKASTQIEREITEFQNRYHTKPKVLITYKRQAFYLKDDYDLRVTFDFDLKYKLYNREMLFDENGDLIINDQNKFCLMEIKSNKNLPRYLIDEMSKLKIYSTSFSKIGYCYQNFVIKKERNKNVKYNFK